MGAERRHHATAWLQLGDQSGRQISSGGGDDDAIKRRFLGPTVATIAVAHHDIAIPQIEQAGNRPPRQETGGAPETCWYRSTNSC